MHDPPLPESLNLEVRASLIASAPDAGEASAGGARRGRICRGRRGRAPTQREQRRRRQQEQPAGGAVARRDDGAVIVVGGVVGLPIDRDLEPPILEVGLAVGVDGGGVEPTRQVVEERAVDDQLVVAGDERRVRFRDRQLGEDL
ncbi:MAG: hypothetical protein ABI629_20345 [bacterium]